MSEAASGGSVAYGRLAEYGRRDLERRPRLLTLTPDFSPSVGGIQLLLDRLLARLPDFEHLVVARRAEGNETVPFAVRRTRLAGGPASIAELNARAFLVGRRFRPDVVLNGHINTSPAALAIGSARRVPVITYAYADELTHREWMTRLGLRRSTINIAISRYTADLVRHHAPNVPIELVVPGFDVRPPSSTARDGRPTIVTIARLTDRYKGHDVVLESMRHVLEAVPDTQWLVAGDGPLRRELEASAVRLGVADRVQFLGFVSDEVRAELLARAWVFVMPSRMPPRGAGGEGFGIVYLEAAAAGVPVVAGRVAGALDAVDDGRTGFLVDPEDAGAVAGALTRILADPSLRESFGRAGEEWSARFSWERMADDVGAVLRRGTSRPG